MAGITEYPIPSGPNGPQEITSGPDGALWFTENGANKIGRISVTGVVTEFTVPTANGKPWGITSGPDGALWFTENGGNEIGRITTAGAFTEYTIPTGNSQPQGIAVGPDGALWFTEFGTGKIGQITTAGVFNEYATSQSDSQPYEITSGPDGALWFTEYNKGLIGRITTSGVLTTFATSKNDSKPAGITAGPDGAIWFTESSKSNVDRLTTAGALTEYPVPNSGPQLGDITTGSDGNLWYTQYGASGATQNQIGRITTAGVGTQFATPQNISPEGIVSGPDGALWFTENSANRVGRLAVTSAATTVVSANNNPSVYGQGVTFTATVSGPSGTPTGTVSFYEGSTVLGTASLSGGAATFTTPSLPAGVDGIRVQYGGDIQYAATSSATFNQTVNTAPLYATAVKATMTYGSPVPLPYVYYSGLVNRDTTSVFSGLLSNPATSSTGVGSYPYSLGAFSAGPNYHIVFTSDTLSVTPANLTVTGDTIGKVYGAVMPALTFTASGLVGGDTASVFTGALTTTANSGSVVGNYQIRQGSLSAGPNYVLHYTSGTLNVTPAILTVAAGSPGKVYGAPVPALTYSYTGLVNGDTSSVLTGGLTTPAAAGSGAGTYPVSKGTLSAGPNYSIAYTPGTLTVTQAPLTVASDNVGKVYGPATPALTYTYSGLVNGDTPSVFTGALSAPGNHVGVYGINLGTLSAGPNYAIGFNPATLTVTPAPLSVTADMLAKTYGAPLPALTYAYNGLVNGDTPAVFSGSLTTAATASSAVGSYPVGRGTLSAGPDYAVTFGAGTLDVSPATLSVAADSPSKVYGAPVPALTYSYTGLVNGDNASVLTGTVVTPATSSSVAGAYPVNQGTLSAGPNYSIAYDPGNLTVTPAPLSVRAVDQVKIYGAAVPVLAYGESGLVNGDTAAVFSGALATTASASSDVGTYPIGQGTVSAGPDYVIGYTAGSLTVAPAALTVNTDDPSQVYGTPLPRLTFHASGLVNGDTISVFKGALDTTAASGSGVGQYPVGLGTLSAGGNYAIRYSPGALTVTPAPLSVTATLLSTRYGVPLPALTYTYFGLVNGDTRGVFSGGLASQAASGSGVGVYGIDQGTFDAGPNYAISFNPGTLTVTPAPLTVTAENASRAFGQPNPAFSASYNGLVNGDTPTSLDGSLTFTTPAIADSRVGTYPVRPGGLTSTDYAIDYGDGSLTVEPLKLSATGSTVAAVAGVKFSGEVAMFGPPDVSPRPDRYDATIRWGDGQVSAGEIGFDPTRGVYTVDGMNTYQAEGVYAVRITIQAGGALAATADTVAAVTDAPLTVTGSSFTPVKGESYVGEVARFVDEAQSSKASDFTATIAWGDGTSSPGAVVADGGGGYQVVGVHTYLGSNRFNVSVTVDDRGGSRSESLVVVRVVPTPTPPGVGTPTPTTTDPNPGKGPAAGIGSSPVVVIGVPVAAITPSAMVPVGNVGLAGVPSASGRGGVVAVPSPGVLGPGPGVALPSYFGGGSGPVRETATAATAAAGGKVTGKGPTVSGIQAAFELAMEAVARQIDALLGLQVRAGAVPTVRDKGPVREAIATPRSLADLAAPSDYLWARLDDLDGQVSSGQGERQVARLLGTGVVAYVGYVLLNGRAGYALMSLLTAKPLWSQVDPLAVLLDWEGDPRRKARRADDEETLQSLIESSRGWEGDEIGDSDIAPEPGAHELDRQPPVRGPRVRALARPRGRRTQRA